MYRLKSTYQRGCIFWTLYVQVMRYNKNTMHLAQLWCSLPIPIKVPVPVGMTSPCVSRFSNNNCPLVCPTLFDTGVFSVFCKVILKTIGLKGGCFVTTLKQVQCVHCYLPGWCRFCGQFEDWIQWSLLSLVDTHKTVIKNNNFKNITFIGYSG